MTIAPSAHRSIMAQRIEPADSLEFFPTPPWATRALMEAMGAGEKSESFVCWEPAAGEGHMAEPLREHFAHVITSDIHDYGAGYQVGPYIGDGSIPDPGYDWMITNPPFSLASQFLSRGLKEARRGVALLVRNSWLETADRYEEIFSKSPPSVIFQFSERVGIWKDIWVPSGGTATSYVWCVWFTAVPESQRDDWAPTRFQWIPPGRRAALTKEVDLIRFAKEDPNAETKKAARKAAKVAATPIETVAVNLVVEALDDEMVVADW